jgi:hypothetical protein
MAQFVCMCCEKFPEASNCTRLSASVKDYGGDGGQEGLSKNLRAVLDKDLSNDTSLSQPLKVPSGQIRYVCEWYNWIGLEKNINNYRFFFNFDHEFCIRVESSEPLDTKIHLIIQIFGRWVVCAQTAIFSSKPIPKMRDYTVHFMFGGIFEESQQPTIQTKIVQHQILL